MPAGSAKAYVPAIDGLRTVAVLLVVIFHADKTWMPGGFIGVDVFFVISGFLITRNIMADVENGSWSFSTFFARRIARLFPALYATIAATLAAAFFLLSPPDLERLGHVAISTILSVSNIFFWMEAGYFDISADHKPLLHTWSLAVEEQFYLVWPLLILALFSLGRRRAVIWGLGAIGIVSFLLAMGLQNKAPSAVFFLTPFRAYQFALGGLIGLSTLPIPGRIYPYAGLLGLAVITVLGFLVDGASSGHFWTATMPALAASAVIVAASTKPVDALLGNRPMVWIGRRSYSIYLVHWPLMVFWTIKSGGYSVPEGLFLCGLSIVLGSGLHAMVEKRFRFTPAISARRKGAVMAGVAFTALAITVTGAHYWGEDGYPGRVPEELVRLSGNLTHHWTARQKALNTGKCNLVHDFKASDFDHDFCARIDPDKPSYLIAGDSFASDMYLVFSKAFPDVHFLQLTIPGCNLRLPDRFAKEHSQACRELYQRTFDDIVKTPGLDGIIMSSNWIRGQYHLIDEMVDELENSDIKIMLVGQHIRFKDRLPSIVLSSMSVDEAKSKAAAFLEAEPMIVNNQLRQRFADKVAFFDFIALQCPDECDTIHDDVGLMYLDDSHLSLKGAEHLAARIASQQPDLFSEKSAAAGPAKPGSS